MDEATLETIANLQQELARMREELVALREEVRAGRERMIVSMRGQTRCPACGHHELLHCSEILDRGESNSRNSMAVDKKGIIFQKSVGQFEIFVCLACRLVEWYVDDVSEIDQDGVKRRVIRGAAPPGEGPYR